jgi:uncharacterized SAM-binding protein YcdF (DUF218 family)
VNELREADAILVLGAGLEPDGAPSAAMRARAAHAAWLYRQGYADLIAVTGGPPPGLPSEAQVTRDLIMAAGVPGDAIVMEEVSESTVENLVYIMPVLTVREVERVLLVTSPFHNWRAEHIAEDNGLTVYLSPAPTDPAERKPLRRVYYIAREAAAWLVYISTGQ